MSFCDSVFSILHILKAARIQEEEVKRAERLATDFAARVPKLKFSPAEILSFLLEYKQSPGEAVDNVEVWITRILEDREKAKNKEKRLDGVLMPFQPARLRPFPPCLLRADGRLHYPPLLFLFLFLFH
jgi:hypothetical protein